MKVLFSMPASCNCTVSMLPNNYDFLLHEGKLSWKLAKRLPISGYSDYLLRPYLLYLLLKKKKHYDVVITGKYGEYFSLMQALVPHNKRIKHFLMDVEWPFRKDIGKKNTIRIIKQRLIAKGADKIQVFCEEEAENYSTYFGIPKTKFVWIPYCTDVDGKEFRAAEEDYIFTGGTQQRDYETLHQAVKDLPHKVVVATHMDMIPSRFISDNMHITGHIPNTKFFEMMAKAKIVVLSLLPGFLRCSGVTTYAIAMRMGKCVIVNDAKGAKSYIKNYSNGIIVQEKDPNLLRQAIEECMSNDKLRQTLALNAKLYAEENLSNSKYVELIGRVINSVHRK